MVRILIVSLCSVVALGVTPVFADFMNGKQLEKYCRSSDVGETMYCAGYLAAMYDALKLVNKGEYEDYHFCPPKNVNMKIKEIASAVEKYINTLSDNDREIYGASGLVSIAIARKFPCSSGSGSSSGTSSGSSGASRGAAPTYSENPFAK